MEKEKTKKKREKKEYEDNLEKASANQLQPTL